MAPTRGYITVVTGLPRSGTSMMMQMLEAGGITALVDDLRPPDRHNPGGYHEYQRVTRLASDQDWLPEAQGKVVKMVYRLLYELPREFDYRVVWMRRRLDEVTASQDAMLLDTAPAQAASMDPTQVIDAFSRQLDEFGEWLGRQPNKRSRVVDYNAILEDPRPSIAAVHRFLDGRLDVAAMERVVDPALYRQRSRQPCG
jgi:hypothetical protein